MEPAAWDSTMARSTTTLLQPFFEKNFPTTKSNSWKEVFFRRESLTSFLDRTKSLPPVSEPIDFDVPISRPGKILAIAKNFASHAAEFGGKVPPEPVFFAKLGSALLAHGKPIQIPYWLTTRVDHEAEIALIVGRKGKHIPPEKAFEYVGGYTIFNDVTARKIQGDDRKKGHPWLRSKSFDTSAPCGPYWVPSDYLTDLNLLRIECRVNGETRQRGKLAELVHPIPKVIATISQHVTLEPGDLIALGTPSGVGPIVPGDLVECEASPIGTLQNSVVREKAPANTQLHLDKEEIFRSLNPNLEKVLTGAKNKKEIFSKLVNLLHDSVPHFHWTGIYFLEGETLILGPFRGKPTEHTRIPVGRGICGRAVAEKKSIVVEDITKETNYLACSLTTRSEIVVPIYHQGRQGKIIGEIDIDSDLPNAFDHRDKDFLEEVVVKVSGTFTA